MTRIFHQIWIGPPKTKPQYANQAIVSFLSFHSNWRLINWDTDSVGDFIDDHFPEIANQYDNLPSNIIKADVARLLILIKKGGLYVDCDYVFYRNIEKLLTHPLTLFKEHFEENITNSIMYASPETPHLRELVQKINWDKLPTTTEEILSFCGPKFITKNQPEAKVHPHMYFEYYLPGADVPLIHSFMIGQHHGKKSWL